jgi:hypothetical protein
MGGGRPMTPVERRRRSVEALTIVDDGDGGRAARRLAGDGTSCMPPRLSRDARLHQLRVRVAIGDADTS